MATAGSPRTTNAVSPGRAVLITLAVIGVLTPAFMSFTDDFWTAGMMAGKYAFTGFAVLLLAQFLLGLIASESLLHKLLAWMGRPFNRPLAHAVGLDPNGRIAPVVTAICVYVVKVSLFGEGDLPPPWLIVLRGLF